MRRGKRKDRREDRRGSGSGKNRYKMREKLVSIGDDFWIENAQGQKTFKVDGKALRVRQTLKFEDAHGHELCKIQGRKVRVKDTMEVEDAHGHNVRCRHLRELLPLKEDGALPRAEQPGNGLEGGALPGSVRPDERDDFALVHMEGDALQGVDGAVEDIQIIDFEQCGHDLLYLLPTLPR